MSKKYKHRALESEDFLNSQWEEATPEKIKPGINDIMSLFKQLPAGSRKEALAVMEHMQEYGNMDFWDYQNKVFGLSCELDDLRNLFAVLYENCFSWGENEIDQDKVEREVFIRSYGKIKTLISTMWTIANNAAEVAYALSSEEFFKAERA